MPQVALHRCASIVPTAIYFAFLLLCGCSNRTLMPTPNVYVDTPGDPFGEVPPALRSPDVSILYVTDRVPTGEVDGRLRYGDGRSRSAAFGDAVVRIGPSATWEQIVEASRTRDREVELRLDVVSVREVERFAPTPRELILSDAQLDAATAPPPDPQELAAEQAFREELSRRLALTPRKDVFIFVHGFANSFDTAMVTCAELWHFVMGREGVPIAYAWPAAKGGIRAYEYTLDSTQFTIFHFKQMLRLVASCPDVRKVHILAHSRGAALTSDVVRELFIELRSTEDVRKSLKLGTVALAAADIDLDVAIERDSTERIVRAMDHAALYLSHHDEALAISGWLFGGDQRIGDLKSDIFTPQELAELRTSTRYQFIDARVHDVGLFGHGYFHASPSVSSDLVLLLREGRLPGAEHGRPLDIGTHGFWEIRSGYPGDVRLGGSRVGASQDGQPASDEASMGAMRQF